MYRDKLFKNKGHCSKMCGPNGALHNVDMANLLTAIICLHSKQIQILH